MFESRSKPLLPLKAFYRRWLMWAALSLLLVAVVLGIGMAGYHGFEQMTWVDAFENAAMILSGMGPADNLKSNAGKIFAGCYALFSGLAFLTSIGLVFAPLLHRFLHRFHLESSKAKGGN
ncbi:MAG TPA: hypothetical protein VFV81_05885 [Verrucomicrobiae bacterium]|nr:hypothetical protein [Verrucomicrobiae bacterium]